MNFYQGRIKEYCDQYYPTMKVDPRHVEANMRLVYGTLDGLSPSRFEEEIRLGVAFIRIAGIEEAERLAQSFDL